MKIGVSLIVVFIVCFLPMFYVITIDAPISGYFRFTYYINNLANFFIYLAVDQEFRMQIGRLVVRPKKTVRIISYKLRFTDHANTTAAQ